MDKADLTDWGLYQRGNLRTCPVVLFRIVVSRQDCLLGLTSQDRKKERKYMPMVKNKVVLVVSSHWLLFCGQVKDCLLLRVDAMH